MEIIIFRRNEINFNLFKNQALFSYQQYKDISSLKNEIYGNFADLDNTKAKLDSLDSNLESFRRTAAKYLNEHELVHLLCKKQVISRAYFKLYEIIYFEPLMSKSNCDSFFICEAPGGFIECVTDIRRKKNLQTKFMSISKYDPNIKYSNKLSCGFKDIPCSLFYEDITEISVINKTIEISKNRFVNGFDLITADGGFDVKIFVAQEILSSKLLLCEIYLALMTQKIGGTFVIKFFDMVSHNSIIYYLILCMFYKYVKIIKPKCSRNCNSERYLVCYGFLGGDVLFLNEIKQVITHFKINKNKVTLLFPNFNFKILPDLKKISIFNNLIIYEQIKTINESIKMVNNKNTYFQNLIFRLFREQNLNKLNLFIYKNILNSRIKKCLSFLKLHNITANQFKL